MNRRDLFKRAGLLAAGAVAAPLAGKATPEPEVTWSEPITGEAVDFGSDLIVDGKKIGTVHSVEFSQPFTTTTAAATYFYADRRNFTTTWPLSRPGGIDLNDWYDYDDS